jgi:hypothetical protein
VSEPRGLRIGFLFVPFPQDIWRNGLDMTLGEFRLLGYLLMHQVMFARAIVMLSDDELLNGRRLSDGSRADRGCGIRGRNNLKDARERLEKKGWISTEIRPMGRMYEVVLGVSDSDTPSNKSDAGVSDLDSPKRTLGVSESDRKVSDSDRQVSESDTPNKERKEKSKENSKFRSQESVRADARHTPTRDAITRLQLQSDPGFVVWDHTAESELANLLAAKPDIPLGKLQMCVVARWLSPDTAAADHPRRWIKNLLDYASGPINRYRDAVEYNGGEFRKLLAIAGVNSELQRGDA